MIKKKNEEFEVLIGSIERDRFEEIRLLKVQAYNDMIRYSNKTNRLGNIQYLSYKDLRAMNSEYKKVTTEVLEYEVKEIKRVFKPYIFKHSTEIHIEEPVERSLSDYGLFINMLNNENLNTIKNNRLSIHKFGTLYIKNERINKLKIEDIESIKLLIRGTSYFVVLTHKPKENELAELKESDKELVYEYYYPILSKNCLETKILNKYLSGYGIAYNMVMKTALSSYNETGIAKILSVKDIYDIEDALRAVNRFIILNARNRAKKDFESKNTEPLVLVYESTLRSSLKMYDDKVYIPNIGYLLIETTNRKLLPEDVTSFKIIKNKNSVDIKYILCVYSKVSDLRSKSIRSKEGVL